MKNKQQRILFLGQLVLVLCFLTPSLIMASEASLLDSCVAEKSLDPEKKLIKKTVVEQYIRGLKERDFSLITTICIPEAKLMSVNRANQLNVTTLKKWSKRFDPKNPPFKKLEYKIARIDRAGTAAQVKINFLVDSKQKVTDYLHMLKIDNRWRIVNIIDF